MSRRVSLASTKRKHGTHSAYVYGCRCTKCVQGQSEYKRNWYGKSINQTFLNAIKSASKESLKLNIEWHKELLRTYRAALRERGIKKR